MREDALQSSLLLASLLYTAFLGRFVLVRLLDCGCACSIEFDKELRWRLELWSREDIVLLRFGGDGMVVH